MLRLFREIYRFLVRASAFISKEIVEVVRQTPLICHPGVGTFSDHAAVWHWIPE